MSGRKAAIEIQFNWIFVLIAGAIILTFFGGLVYKQKTLADEEAAGSIIKNLEAEFSAARSAGGSAALLDLGKFEIDLKCEDYLVGKLGQSVSFRPFFGPDLVKGMKLVVWSFPWDFPFKITNFIFVSSKDVGYFFVNSSDPLMISLNDDLSFRFFSSSLINSVSEVNNPAGFYKIRFVCNGCDFSNEVVSFGFPEKDMSAVSFDESSKTVTFYQKSGDSFVATGTAPLLGFDDYGMPSVFGAVFADSYELYDCNLKKAFRNLGVVSEVYEKRSRVIADSSSDCNVYHLNAAEDFANIKSQSSDFSSASIGEILKSVDDLDTTQGFVRRSSCPWLY